MRLNVNQLSLILASQSPRRKELLGMLNIPFQIKVAHDEEIGNEDNPQALAMELAFQKAEATLRDFKKENFKGPGLIVGADTIVELEKTIYGKPQDREEAKRFLLELSGKTHLVTTGVALILSGEGVDEDQEHRFYVSTEVTFSEISPYLLESYLNTNEWADKAGAYGIQGSALSFVQEIRGSYSNVVGFPLAKFVSELQDFLQTSSIDQLPWK
jgi:septum formation protein